MSAVKKILDWVNKKTGTASMAFANVEKNALSQTGELMSTNITQSQRLTQGQVLDSLVNGEVTQEVMDLRWRTYKIMQASESFTAEITGYEADGTPITLTTKIDKKIGLKGIKVDSYDDYKLELVVNNDEITIGANEAMDNEYISLTNTAIINYDDYGKPISKTHGTINGEEYFASSKTERPILIISNLSRQFNLENYTTKLNVRTINDTEKLLEFYVSVYPDMYNRTSRLFLSEVKKAITSKNGSSILEIDEVHFITDKTIGAYDNHQYQYNIKSFDKIVEFNGNYVIKFIATPIINGLDILAKHRQLDLEERYRTKEKK